MLERDLLAPKGLLAVVPQTDQKLQSSELHEVETTTAHRGVCMHRAPSPRLYM